MLETQITQENIHERARITMPVHESINPPPPPTKDELFISKLDEAIEFHRANQNDPHAISAAVVCSLIEVREAFAESHGLPMMLPRR